jgi:hypothetical protein
MLLDGEEAAGLRNICRSDLNHLQHTAIVMILILVGRVGGESGSFYRMPVWQHRNCSNEG